MLAFQILLACGHYEGKEPLTICDRIPLRNPIDGQQSLLTWCIVAPPDGYPASFKLPSGRVEFLHLVGITEGEARFARENGHEALLRRLAPIGYPVTNAVRMSVAQKGDQLAAVLKSGYMTLTADTDPAIHFYGTVVSCRRTVASVSQAIVPAPSGGPMKVEATRLCLRFEPTCHCR